MANVRLAPVLRASAGGSKVVSVQGSTLSEVLSDLFGRYPSLKEQIQPGDELSKFVNVYVNDQDVRFLQGLQTGVGPADTVTLLPAMARGHCMPLYESPLRLNVGKLWSSWPTAGGNT